MLSYENFTLLDQSGKVYYPSSGFDPMVVGPLKGNRVKVGFTGISLTDKIAAIAYDYDKPNQIIMDLEDQLQLSDEKVYGTQTKISLNNVSGLGTKASDEPLKEVSSSEVLTKIRLGLPVEYDHVLIRGDLDLSQLNLPIIPTNRETSQVLDRGASDNLTLVNSTINLTSSKIDGCVDLGNAVFLKRVDFRNTEFVGSSNFSGCQFNEAADFGWDTFDNNVTFRAAQFNMTAHFEGANFLKNASFFEAEFDEAYFNGARFAGSASFSRATFNPVARFENTEFLGPCLCNEAEFLNVFFIGANFTGPCCFDGAWFFRDADFRLSEFHQNASFQDVEFGGDTRFSDARFEGNAIFQNSSFLGDTNILNIDFNGLNGYEFNCTWIRENEDQKLAYARETCMGNGSFCQVKFAPRGRFGSQGNFIKFEPGYNQMEIRENGNVSLYNINKNFSFDLAKQNLFFHMGLYNCTNFNISKNKESADFQNATFLGETYFADNEGGRSAEFFYDANFTDSQFSSDAFFSGVRFIGNAYFTGAKFGKAAYFEGSKFDGSAQFSNVQFNDTANFRGSLFGGRVILERVTYGKPANFSEVQFS